MYKHILVPTDGTPLSMKAARAAAKLAEKLGARITSIYVIEPYRPPLAEESVVFHSMYSMKEHDKAMHKIADKAFARVATVAKGLTFDTMAPKSERPWQAIVDAAKERKCDLIVMSSHGRRGLAGLLLGSETQKVLTHSKVPVLVCR
jgi:nucleotide-binding universal stress UspA family protein